jgi:predicted Zn-dependent peptidase
LIISATARDGVTAEQLEAGLVEVLDEVADGVTEAELDRARALLTTAWWRQLASVDGRADILGRHATQLGDPGRAGERLPGWLAVTADQVTRLAAELLRPADRVTLTYLPEKEVAE